MTQLIYPALTPFFIYDLIKTPAPFRAYPHLCKERIILQGNVPNPANPPSGCPFHERCVHCMGVCKQEMPELKEVSPGHYVSCHLYDK